MYLQAGTCRAWNRYYFMQRQLEERKVLSDQKRDFHGGSGGRGRSRAALGNQSGSDAGTGKKQAAVGVRGSGAASPPTGLRKNLAAEIFES